MYNEKDFVMISALQHLAFCERQCALIHIEQQWAENRYTVLGELMHEKVHSTDSETRGDCLIARSLRLVSYRLGLVGKADVVEFHRCKREAEGISLPGRKGSWMPFPVEYKKGRPKTDNVDRVQLCAQALCLEEQLDIEINTGALFYGDKKRRLNTIFDAELRNETIQLSEKLHRLIESGKTPIVKYEKKCRQCSLYDVCNPKIASILNQNKYEAILFSEED